MTVATRWLSVYRPWPSTTQSKNYRLRLYHERGYERTQRPEAFVKNTCTRVAHPRIQESRQIVGGTLCRNPESNRLVDHRCCWRCSRRSELAGRVCRRYAKNRVTTVFQRKKKRFIRLNRTNFTKHPSHRRSPRKPLFWLAAGRVWR